MSAVVPVAARVIPAELPQKGISASIFRSGDRREHHGGTGISKRVDSVIVLCEGGNITPLVTDIVLVIEKRDYLGSAPMAWVLDQGRGVAMFGGTYVAASDSRFSETAGIYGAVAVHDRIEG